MNFSQSHMYDATTHGNIMAHETPAKMPVISMAAANMPAVCACCGDTVCGAYIMPNELDIEKKKSLAQLAANIVLLILYRALT